MDCCYKGRERLKALEAAWKNPVATKEQVLAELKRLGLVFEERVSTGTGSIFYPTPDDSELIAMEGLWENVVRACEDYCYEQDSSDNSGEDGVY